VVLNNVILSTPIVYIVLVIINIDSWIRLLGGPEDDLIRSKHVALTKYTICVYK
jgi:hypothetical protein